MANCPRCGNKMEKGWNFCPRCGYRHSADLGFNSFDKIFSRAFRQMREMNKQIEKQFEAFDISPFFRPLTREDMEKVRGGKPVKKGFSIRIFQRNHNKPKVYIRTFGDVDREKIKHELYEQLGKKRSTEKKTRILFPKLFRPKEEKPGHKIALKMPSVTEEPKTEVRRTDSRVVVEIDMPGVKSMGMIDVRELENSVEVKAIADNKAYFKILTKPAQYRMAGKKFREGKLTLEFM